MVTSSWKKILKENKRMREQVTEMRMLMECRQANEAQRFTALKDVVICPVCLDNFSKITKSPVTLHCGHTICSTCLNKYKDTNIRQCAVCRSLSIFAFSELSKNVLLSELLDVFGLLGSDEIFNESLVEEERKISVMESITLENIENISQTSVTNLMKTILEFLSVFHTLKTYEFIPVQSLELPMSLMRSCLSKAKENQNHFKAQMSCFFNFVTTHLGNPSPEHDNNEKDEGLQSVSAS